MKSAVSHFSSVQEAPTPTTSNRTAPIKSPPPLLLSQCNTSSDDPNTAWRSPQDPRSATQRVKSNRQPRFSSPTAAPIIFSRAPTSSRSHESFNLTSNHHVSSLTEPSWASVSGDISLMGPAPFLQVIPLTLFCDFVKAGVPLRLLRKLVLRFIRRAVQRDTQQFMSRGLAFRVTQLDPTEEQVDGLTRIRGIPNYGQTCFMNSVLQALASLEPFLVYLDRIIQIRNQLCLDSSTGSSSFSRQLLDILDTINGRAMSTRDRIDTRNLLKLIGEHNSQFRSTYLEQQDAQELLQALIDIVVIDAQLDGTSSSDQYLRFVDHLDDSYAETLTAAMAGDESSLNWSSAGSSDLSEIDAGRFVSLPDLVHRIETEHKDSIGHDGNRNAGNQIREEKKQEDFEITSRLATVGGAAEAYENQLLKTEKIVEDPKQDSRNLTTSMQILKTTMSSITPSPLSGWMGSALRCCNCNYVRAIRNAPFLNIPLVPTSVLEYHANTHQRQNFVSPNRSPMPSCTLHQCLSDFTSVERVHDVECRSCSIQKELERLDDEALLLRGAISSMEKRILKKGGNPSGQVKCLRDDLSQVELRIMKLKLVDPDDEDAFIGSSTSPDEEAFAMSGEGNCAEKIEPLERCDALKCLTLTRCPSILCCHIQRRYSDPLTGRMEKCVQFVECPQILDLSPYCAYSPSTNTAWAAGTSKDCELETPVAGTRLLYQLQGIIEHRGNANGGHYICYRRNQSGDWFRISDANVSPIPWRQVRTSQAYMVFYEAL